MQYAIARGVFTSLKWFWLAFLAVFAVTYAANVAPLPFKQVTHQFYDSTFGMLFLPGLHLTLTLLALGALALLTLLSWLIARRAPEELPELAAASVQQSHHNVGDTIQAQDQGQVYHIKEISGSTLIFSEKRDETTVRSPSPAQREALVNGYLDGIISRNRLINPTGINEPASLPIFSVNVPLEQVFVHLRAVSDRPRFGMALEREQLEQEIQRIYERSDLTDEEREEHIQQLRAASWRSEMVEGMLASIAKAGKDLTIENVFTDLKAGSPVAIFWAGRERARVRPCAGWRCAWPARCVTARSLSRPMRPRSSLCCCASAITLPIWWTRKTRSLVRPAARAAPISSWPS